MEEHKNETIHTPCEINMGKIYEIMFGEDRKKVYITSRNGDTLETCFFWNGTLIKEGKKVQIHNAARFIREVTTEQFGPPWLISLEIFDKSFDEGKLNSFDLSIRERDTHRLIADFPCIPSEAWPSCAEVIRNAVRMCQSGPGGFDVEKIHFSDEKNDRYMGVSVDLTFDLWDPIFAGEDYIEALFRKIESAKLNMKSPCAKNSFQRNPEGKGAVYWTEKTGVLKILCVCHDCLKSLFLQSEKDIINFAESIFGEHGHSFEDLRKILEYHEGEWFDPPENFALYSSYDERQFTSATISVLGRVYESDADEGKEYYGRIVACENKSTCPEILNWTLHENKIWLRVNDGDDSDYTGPFENHLLAAKEAYCQYFI